MKKPKTLNQLLKENEKLRIKLQEAEDTLQAIHEGAVDAIVVKGRKGEKIFTLTGEEQIYRRLVETMGEAGLTTTPEGKILFCNQQCSKMLGLPMEEIAGKDLEKFVKKTDLKTITALLIRAQVEPTRKRLSFLAGDGTSVPAWVSANLLEHDDTVSICLVAMDQTELEATKEAMRQISEQRKELAAQREKLQVQNDELVESQGRLAKLNRILRALSNSNQAMMRATDERQFLNEVCKIIVKDCGYTMVWIGFAQDNEEKSVKPVAYSGFEKGYLETLKITWADTPRGLGPTGTAVRTGKVSICANILTDPKLKPWRAEAKKRGYASSVAFPLLADSKAFGALVIYSKELDPFSEVEVNLLTELAGDLAYGIAAIRLRKAKEQAEKELRESQAQLALAADAAKIGIFDWHIHSGELYWTARHEQIFGYPTTTTTTTTTTTHSYKDWSSRVHPEDLPRIEESVSRAMDEGTLNDDEYRIIWPDGSIHWVMVRALFHYDEGGQATRMLGTVIDITECKQAEEQLRDAHQRYSKLFSNRIYGMAHCRTVTDKKGNPVNYVILEVNETYERIIGKKKADIDGKLVTEVFPGIENMPSDYIRKYGRIALEGGELLFEDFFPATGQWLLIYAYSPKPGEFAALFIDITAQKQAEEKLRKSEREKGLILDNANEVIAYHDKDHNLIWANKAYLDAIGLSLAQVKSKKCYHAWGLKKLCKNCPVTTAIETDKAQSAELTPQNQPDWPSGLGSWIVKAAPVKDESGNIIGAIEVAIDITERKQAEETLRTTMQRFYSTLSSMYGSILLVNSEGKVEFANRSFCELFNLNVTPEKLVGLTSDEMIEKIKNGYAEPEKAVKRIRAIVKDGKAVKGEEVAMSDGQMCLRDFIPIDLGDKSYGRLWHHIDITKRKQAEEALRESERCERERAGELAALFDAVPTPVFIAHDPDCRHITGNRAADELLCNPRGGEASLGAPIDTRPHHFRAFKDGRELAVKELPAQRAARGERVEGMEFSLVFDDGTVREVIGYGMPLQNADGQPRGSILALLDITERKKAEEHLKAITEELQRSNTDLQQFAYVASHNLREPLRAINGFMELLKQRYEEKLDAKANEYIDYAANGARRMDDLLTGLLAYARVQTKGQQKASISAQAVLNAAVKNLQRSIAESNAAITSDTLPSVKADGMQFTQLLQNLIGNAIKFRTDKRPEINVGCKRQENTWLFSIRDNGIGIDPQNHERIFEIFRQLHARDKYPGFGVGLAICKRIVERHGGKIWLESEEGKGSTFYFTIPD